MERGFIDRNGKEVIFQTVLRISTMAIEVKLDGDCINKTGKSRSRSGFGYLKIPINGYFGAVKKGIILRC